MSLKKVTTSITYRVPAWEFCNLNSHKIGVPSSEKCRFCIKEKDYHRCALYNAVLNNENGAYVVKTADCKRAVAGFRSVVEYIAPEPVGPNVPPKQLMKQTIKEYVKYKKQLLAQGYPVAIADKFAQEYVLGGN